MPKRLLNRWQASDDENCHDDYQEYVGESELINDTHYASTLAAAPVHIFLPETILNENKDQHAQKKIRNRRRTSKTNWESEFTKMICNGKIEVAAELIQQFFTLNVNSETKIEADGMLRTFIMKGAKEDMLRTVFKIGGDRYRRLRDNRPVREKGGRNGNAVSQDIIEQLKRMVEQIPIEEGYSLCSHRRKLYFITDLNISSWLALYEQCYKPFEPDEPVRKIGFTTFYNHMQAQHPNLRFNRLKEEICDLCPRKAESKNKVSASDET